MYRMIITLLSYKSMAYDEKVWIVKVPYGAIYGMALLAGSGLRLVGAVM